MSITEQMEQIAERLGTNAVHLIYLHQSKRWLVISLWGKGEAARFKACETAEAALEAALQENDTEV